MQDAALALLAVGTVLGLVLVPFGLPGLWVMVLAIVGYGWLTQFRTVGTAMLVLVIALALAGELVEAWVGFGFARRYGGSRRAGWGALVGGLVGATAGVPVPLVGSIVGGLVGAFVGAALFEYTRERRAGVAARAGWGAMLGRALAAGFKIGLGLVIAVIAVFAALRG